MSTPTDAELVMPQSLSESVAIKSMNAMQIRAGAEPAFPHSFGPRDNTFEGMTLRDYFAAHALAAMTTAPDYSKGPCNAAMAERAFLIADHMLRMR